MKPYRISWVYQDGVATATFADKAEAFAKWKEVTREKGTLYAVRFGKAGFPEEEYIESDQR